MWRNTSQSSGQHLDDNTTAFSGDNTGWDKKPLNTWWAHLNVNVNISKWGLSSNTTWYLVTGEIICYCTCTFNFFLSRCFMSHEIIVGGKLVTTSACLDLTLLDESHSRREEDMNRKCEPEFGICDFFGIWMPPIKWNQSYVCTFCWIIIVHTDKHPWPPHNILQTKHLIHHSSVVNFCNISYSRRVIHSYWNLPSSSVLVIINHHVRNKIVQKRSFE